jgi:SAM-dependent methyltransferase
MRIPTHLQVTSNTIDAALRYRAVLSLLASRWHAGIRVLEVGSGSGGAAEWLDYEVVGVDTAFERTAERARPNLVPRTGSATALPLPDGSFDAVLCVDVLEHIPSADRPVVLSELLRVAAPGGRIVVTFPSGPAAERLDAWLASAYAARHHTPHPWASEHLDLGLPDGREVAELLRAGGAETFLLPNLWAPAWRFLHATYTVGTGLPFTWPLFRRPAVAAVYHVLAHLNREPAYRTIVVADRR